MPKLPECDRCQIYSYTPYLVCGVHPDGPSTLSCPDHAPIPQEVANPLTGGFYAGDWIPETTSHLTTEERLELLDTHPLFIGVCPQCGQTFLAEPTVHWDCDICGWVDDSV